MDLYRTGKTTNGPWNKSVFVMLLSMVLVLCICSLAMTERVKPVIYTELDNQYYCFRRLNQTHQIGCSSPESGSSGIVKVLRDEYFDQDMSFVTTQGSNAPYVVACDEKYFNLSTLQSLKAASKRVAGVLVLDRKKPSAFSSDRSCPNQYYSLYANDYNHQNCRSQEWNKPTPNHHNGILFNDWPFPIFLIRNQTQIEFLLNKTNEYDHWPRLTAELVSPMNAAVDSVSCTRRSRLTESSVFSLNPATFCDPIGGINIYHHTMNLSTFDFNKSNSIVMLAARLDSFSMFDELSPGADSTISSLITILAIADLLNNATIREQMSKVQDKAILFALFDGEALDYIGSSHAAYQMLHNKFHLSENYLDSGKNLNLKHLSYLIELNQVMHHDTSDKLNIYLHKHLHSSPNLDILIKTIENNTRDLTDIAVNRIQDGFPLPPSSAQSFLKLRNDENFTAIVVTNHEKEYTNKYYNSLYDEASNPKLDLSRYLASLATLFSRVAYKLVTDQELNHSYHANETLIDGLIKCFLKTSSCEYFYYAHDYSGVNFTEDNSPPFPTYTSVYSINYHKQLRMYTRALLHFLTGERVKANSVSECHSLGEKDKSQSYVYQNGMSGSGECVRSTVYTVNSISPAFDSETLEVIEANLKDYALWTESKWSRSSLRIFVSSSPLQQWLTFVVGLLVLVLSVLIVMLLNHNSAQLFKHCATETNGDASRPGYQEW